MLGIVTRVVRDEVAAQVEMRCGPFRRAGRGGAGPVSLRAVAAAALLATAACGPPGGERPVLVFAAASLTEAFEALADAFRASDAGTPVELHVAGTPRLVVQVREGAPADVFASADAANMERVLETGRTLGAPRTFARNRLAIVVGEGNPENVQGLADLARDDLAVALCAPEVPAGRYAREALRSAGVVVETVSDEPSVKAVVSKVELGELDAGIVYATDVRSAEERVDGVAIPDDVDVTAEYPIVLVDSRPGRAGEAFLEFVLSGDGRRILESFGFEVP